MINDIDYQKTRIEANQGFLLGLLNLNLFGFYPLRKWLGISYKGKIDEVSHLSIAYNTKYFKKGKKWFKQQTRTYQQPDLGYKLNLLLDKIPQIAIPALLQPAYGLGALVFFFLTQTTYQPSTKDTFLGENAPTTNYGSSTQLRIGSAVDGGGTEATEAHTLLHWNISDIPDSATFSQGDILLYKYDQYYYAADTLYMYRLTQTAWVELEATWNIYSTGNNWITAGGDYTTTNGASRAFDYDAAGWRTWSSSALIQDCYNNQSKNVHLLGLIGHTDYRNVELFYSKEYTDNTSLRPKLTVTYTVPSTMGGAFLLNFV